MQFLLIILIVCIFIVDFSESGSKSQNELIAQAKEIDEKITYEMDHIKGFARLNTEYTTYLDQIRSALPLNYTDLAVKLEHYYEYMTYNKERLKIEGEYLEEMDKINRIIMTGKVCTKFWYHIREEIYNFLTLDNTIKMDFLTNARNLKCKEEVGAKTKDPAHTELLEDYSGSKAIDYDYSNYYGF